MKKDNNGLLMPEIQTFKAKEHEMAVKLIVSNIKFDGYGNIISENKQHDNEINAFIQENNLKQSDIVNILTTDKYDDKLHMLVISTMITYRVRQED